MTTFTKQAIQVAFMELLAEQPFDKITVTDIVSRCGINRNTFYYHFQDIYALVDAIFLDETNKIIDADDDFDSWQEGFLTATQFALENKAAIYHLYDSINRDRLETYLFDVTRQHMHKFVAKQAEGLPTDPVVEDDITKLAAVALEGIVLEWLHEGMKNDPRDYIARMGPVVEGMIRTALERGCR